MEEKEVEKKQKKSIKQFLKDNKKSLRYQIKKQKPDTKTP